MTCLGQLHGASYGKTEMYVGALKKLTQKVPSWQENLKSILDDLFPKIKSLLALLEIPQSDSLLSEINLVLKAPLEPGPFTTFIHGDSCSDNALDRPNENELYLIDFEWSCVRSALLDGTYLRMSMPTCWCAKAIPGDLIDSLEVIYREELKKEIPAAQHDEAYFTAYTHACGFWVVKIFADIEKVMEEDRIGSSGPVPKTCFWKPAENSVRPRVLSRLQAFIDVAKKHDKLPQLSSMAGEVLKELKTRWPDAKPLDVYPAFQKDLILLNKAKNE